jgi:hypothetical protein
MLLAILCNLIGSWFESDAQMICFSTADIAAVAIVRMAAGVGVQVLFQVLFQPEAIGGRRGIGLRSSGSSSHEYQPGSLLP